MYESPIVHNLNHYRGTPEGFSRIGFTMPDGSNRSALVEGVAKDWSVSVFVDESTETIICVATNASKVQLVVERWLNFHAPTRKAYKTKAQQEADLGAGKNASTLSSSAITDALKPSLTVDDQPRAVPQPALELVAAKEHKVKAVGKGRQRKQVIEQRGDYSHHEGKYGPVKQGGPERTEPSWRCRLARGPMLMRTKGDPSLKRSVYINAKHTEIFFLFTLANGSYLLEALRETPAGYQRREATAGAAQAGKTPKKIVEAMAPSLVWDPNAFA